MENRWRAKKKSLLCRSAWAKARGASFLLLLLSRSGNLQPSKRSEEEEEEESPAKKVLERNGRGKALEKKERNSGGRSKDCLDTDWEIFDKVIGRRENFSPWD